ncbi:unnamed protein product [Auanema sp. JU1783]|nr:unnamed protein product [Auanema sp. JU1783]
MGYKIFLFHCFSIGYAAYFSQFSLRKPDHDPCYDQSGRPIRCVPEFINAAFGKPVVATSTCGMNGETRYCFPTKDSEKACSVCNSQDRSLSHSASLLTDMNMQGKTTCWLSEPTDSIGSVNLTLSLGKKFELTYVSMQFCHQTPDSIALFKSADYGKSWTPYQYYSSDCLAVYNKFPDALISKHNEQEAICTDIRSVSPTGNKIAFPLIENRPSALNFEASPVLQDWVTATDIRVVFTRLKPNMIFNDNSSSLLEEYDDLSTNFYSMGDLAVGGRCKCNGHASRCIVDKKGKYSCDCRHNTAGTECETCKPFYFDKPWGRATSRNANVCSVCNCNMHAKRCRFDNEIFKMSGYRSGGVCINCKHNTIGRNCHLCKPGYYRDSTSPLTSRRACKGCQCHPVGSLGRSCNQETGQCVCKDGVAGLTCNRCAKGYQQSRSSVNPCIRIPDKNATLLLPSVGSHEQQKPRGICEKCREFKKVTQRKFCTRDSVLKVMIMNKENEHNWIKYSILVENNFKSTNDTRNLSSLWLPTSFQACKCPKIRVGKHYLVLGMSSRDIDSTKLVYDSKMSLVEWNLQNEEKMTRFQLNTNKNCKHHKHSRIHR